MEKVIWRSYKLGDLFEWNSHHKISKTAKEYNTIDHAEEGYVANVTAGMYNEGIACYLPKDSEIESKKKINCLTISSNGAGVGACFFHDYYFISTGDNALLENRNEKLNDLFNSSRTIPLFFAQIITKLFTNNGIFSWTYKVSKDDFNREIILLPCLEVAAGEDYIWEENGKHYTLAVDYIKKLMDEAKELREQKTIRLYEAERAKYEAERAKYEAEYKKEREKVVWKKFTLTETFSRVTPPSTGVTAKELNITEEPSGNMIPLITRAETNNGIRGYIEKENFPTTTNAITYNDQFSFFLYHEYEFTTIKDHLSIIKAKNEQLQLLLDEYNYVNIFIVTILNHIFSKDIFNFNFTGADYRFDRELILLPCLEVAEGEDFIWEENGKHYTLAVNFISYLYLSGRVNYNQKLIDNYTYQY